MLATMLVGILIALGMRAVAEEVDRGVLVVRKALLQL